MGPRPEPKAPNLSALREAVELAAKKGENVTAVREAQAAFAKAPAKGAIKPGAVPAELTALREAVELAAKKGENVEAISRELWRVEKALYAQLELKPDDLAPRATGVALVEAVPFDHRGGTAPRAYCSNSDSSGVRETSVKRSPSSRTRAGSKSRAGRSRNRSGRHRSRSEARS